MKRKLHILIHAMGMPFDHDTIATKSLGGSETAAYYLAHGLAALGHTVELWRFGNPAEDGLHDGVRYTSIGQVTEHAPLGDRFEKHAAITPHDVLICQRHPYAFHKKWAAKVCIWQLHDLAQHSRTTMIYQGLWQTNAVTAVSEWHKKQIIEVWGLKDEAVHVVPNGVDLKLYDLMRKPDLPAELTEAMQGKFVMLYQSRPERGKDYLVRPGGIMDQLKGTNALLLYCTYDNPLERPDYQQWEAQAEALPNTLNLGALTKQELADVQRSVHLMVYPTKFEEVSCISAMEAMAAGLPMVASDVGALRETCTDAGVTFIALKDGEADVDKFVKAIRNRMASPESMENDRRKQLQAATWRSWDQAAHKLDVLINELFDESQTPQALVRYGFEHSDIQIARSALPVNPGPFVSEQEVEISLYDFATSPEKYKAHYDKHGGIYYDTFEEKVIGENVTGTTRFMGVMSLLTTKQEAMGNEEDGTARPMRVLDYGCAHGHYLIPLASALRKSEFFGVDINERAIGAALKWCIQARLNNVTLAPGTLEAAAQFAVPEQIAIPMEANGEPQQYQQIDNRFDVIIAAEVIEHVPDPEALIAFFRSILKPGGYLIATTPHGRWEWTGTEAFRTAREHLWHFTKHDLHGMMEGLDHEILYADAGADRTGNRLGSYCWRFTEDKDVAPIKLPPVPKRVENLAPRQTVSACLIVKDGDKVLRTCIEAIVDWVDEIVIGVDPTTTDRTREIVAWLEADFPLKPFVVFEGLSALKDGFDAARNATLDRATSDWILWLDADEVLQNPAELWKFLKPSAIDGFGLGQLHYSSDPPRVLNTDYPNRLFRKASGARFYGLVHEHPEVQMGTSIPNVIVRHEAKFLHNGYVNEETRRRRYARNMPLLKLDVEKYPDRVLNKFLMIRDLTQEVGFEVERTGNLTAGQAEQLNLVVDKWEALIDEETHIRMILDGLEYATQALRLLNVGFEFDSDFKFSKPPYHDLNASTGIKGRFRTRDVCNKLLIRLTKETTRHYDSKYL